MSHSREDKTLADEYINQHFAQEDECLLAIRRQLKTDGKEGINVGPHEGKLLQFFVRLHKVKRIVEIGTLYGYSALWLARGLPTEGMIYCLEKDPENFIKARDLLKQSEVSEKVEVIQGEALDSLKLLTKKGPFDMVFIDANKAGYLSYLDWAEENVRAGGLIIGDNTFLFGNVFNDRSQAHLPSNETQVQVMREFNQRLANPLKYNSILIPTHEGMTIAQKL
ncbi:MAG: O-methyltransferase [Bdellovibrionaceae bacterium]|nr:O-methyltransferase [Pseudobdellovibrionaceae bacterium]